MNRSDDGRIISATSSTVCIVADVPMSTPYDPYMSCSEYTIVQMATIVLEYLVLEYKYYTLYHSRGVLVSTLYVRASLQAK